MKLLIVYGTTEGQTRKIAEYLKSEAEKAGAEVSLCDASMEQVRPDRYKAVMIASSMHMQKYQASVIHYIKSNRAALNDIPSAFVSVSLSALAADYDPESFKEMKGLTADFLTDSGWKPIAIEYAAGALRYTQYDFFKKFILRQIAKSNKGNTDTSQDHEYTDWTKLSKFLKAFMETAKAWPTLAEEIL